MGDLYKLTLVLVHLLLLFGIGECTCIHYSAIVIIVVISKTSEANHRAPSRLRVLRHIRRPVMASKVPSLVAEKQSQLHALICAVPVKIMENGGGVTQRCLKETVSSLLLAISRCYLKEIYSSCLCAQGLSNSVYRHVGFCQ